MHANLINNTLVTSFSKENTFIKGKLEKIVMYRD